MDENPWSNVPIYTIIKKSEINPNPVSVDVRIGNWVNPIQNGWKCLVPPRATPASLNRLKDLLDSKAKASEMNDASLDEHGSLWLDKNGNVFVLVFLLDSNGLISNTQMRVPKKALIEKMYKNYKSQLVDIVKKGNCKETNGDGYMPMVPSCLLLDKKPEQTGGGSSSSSAPVELRVEEAKNKKSSVRIEVAPGSELSPTERLESYINKRTALNRGLMMRNFFPVLKGTKAGSASFLDMKKIPKQDFQRLLVRDSSKVSTDGGVRPSLLNISYVTMLFIACIEPSMVELSVINKAEKKLFGQQESSSSSAVPAESPSVPKKEICKTFSDSPQILSEPTDQNPPVPHNEMSKSPSSVPKSATILATEKHDDTAPGALPAWLTDGVLGDAVDSIVPQWTDADKEQIIPLVAGRLLRLALTDDARTKTISGMVSNLVKREGDYAPGSKFMESCANVTIADLMGRKCTQAAPTAAVIKIVLPIAAAVFTHALSGAPRRQLSIGCEDMKKKLEMAQKGRKRSGDELEETVKRLKKVEDERDVLKEESSIASKRLKKVEDERDALKKNVADANAKKATSFMDEVIEF